MTNQEPNTKEKIKFQFEFMLTMIMAGRLEEAQQAFERGIALLDEANIVEPCAECGGEDASPCPEFDKIMCDDCYTEARVTVAHEEGLDTMIEVDEHLQRSKEASQ